MGAITACRTAALGGHVEQCDECGATRIAYNSCRNRHCPKCQGLARAQWLAERQAELLSVPYFHVVFTLPAPVGAIAFQNKALVYAILFRAAAETLATIAADPKHLGAQLGVTMVLHTWGQTLPAPPTCPLRRAGRWPFPRQHTLDRLQKRLLLAGARPTTPAAIPPVIPARPAECLRYGNLRFFGKLRTSPIPRSSPVVSMRSGTQTGLSSPSPHSADPNRCWPISAATLIVSPSPTAG